METLITEDLAVTGSITGSALTDGTAKIAGGNIRCRDSNSNSVNATITKANQPNITSLGTLTNLTVAGDVTADANVLKVNSFNKVGIGRIDPEKTRCS